VVLLIGLVAAAGIPALAMHPWSTISAFEPVARLSDRPFTTTAMVDRLTVVPDANEGFVVGTVAISAAAGLAWAIAFLLLTARSGRRIVRVPIGVAIAVLAVVGVPMVPNFAVERYYDAVRTNGENSTHCEIYDSIDRPVPVAVCNLPFDSPSPDGEPPLATRFAVYDLAEGRPVAIVNALVALSGSGPDGGSTYWAGASMSVLGWVVVFVDSGGLHGVDIAGTARWNLPVASATYDQSSSGASTAESLGHFSDAAKHAVDGVDPARLVAYAVCGDGLWVVDALSGDTISRAGC
jgi:hypothetical protein